MVDWIGIVSACGLAAIVGLGFVMWERYEGQRLARERLQRRLPRRRDSATNSHSRRAA